MNENAAGPSLMEFLSQRPMVLDSAMGTRLIALGMSISNDDPALWNLSHPEAVDSLHQADLVAGSDIIFTNTFGANRDWLARFGKDAESREINRRAVDLARAARSARHYVVGSIGPGFTHIASIEEQSEILEGEGVDAIVFETFRFDQAVAALTAVRPRVEIPLFVSILDWDESIAGQAHQLEDLGASALGSNCIAGLGRVAALAERLRSVTRLPILMKPSAGLLDCPAETPRQFGEAATRLFAIGVRMFGGCCGTTEDHVAEIRKACYDAQTI